MNKGVSGALALILLWIAFAGFFVSFHPGGISDPMFVTKSNPKGQARNPVDVLLWLIKRATQGVPAAAQGAGANADAGQADTSPAPVTVT